MSAGCSALAAGGTCLVAGPLVRRALDMRRTSTFAGNLPLLVRVHRGETAASTLTLSRHGNLLLSYRLVFCVRTGRDRSGQLRSHRARHLPWSGACGLVPAWRPCDSPLVCATPRPSRHGGQTLPPDAKLGRASAGTADFQVPCQEPQHTAPILGEIKSLVEGNQPLRRIPINNSVSHRC